MRKTGERFIHRRLFFPSSSYHLLFFSGLDFLLHQGFQRIPELVLYIHAFLYPFSLPPFFLNHHPLRLSIYPFRLSCRDFVRSRCDASTCFFFVFSSSLITQVDVIDLSLDTHIQRDADTRHTVATAADSAQSKMEKKINKQMKRENVMED